ncbi:Uncharacterised protein [Serratia proteamaculans]|nr:Uncharacterised protein [Serratia proteamaculans]
MLNDDALSAMNLTKPDIGKYIAGTAGGFSAVIPFDGRRFATNTRAEFSEAIKKGEATNVYQASFVTNKCREFCESIKKGSNVNAARWLSGWVNYYLGFFRCSFLSLRPHASSTQEEKLAPGFSSVSRSMLASMSAISSCGKRIAFLSDLLFVFPVAIASAHISVCGGSTPYNKKRHSKTLDVGAHQNVRWAHTLSTGKAQEIHKITKPGSASTLTGPLTTNDRESIEAAMLNHTTHPQGWNTHTQAQPAFTYVFVAIRRTSPQLKHEQRRVIACTEREARKILVRDFILVLASRIAAQAVNHG